jgi:hypothetical protein
MHKIVYQNEEDYYSYLELFLFAVDQLHVVEDYNPHVVCVYIYELAFIMHSPKKVWGFRAPQIWIM